MHCSTVRQGTVPSHDLNHTATHCNTLQHIATHCNTLQHTATHWRSISLTATHYNKLLHTATGYGTQVRPGPLLWSHLLLTPRWFYVLQYLAICCSVLQCVAVCCGALQCVECDLICYRLILISDFPYYLRYSWRPWAFGLLAWDRQINNRAVLVEVGIHKIAILVQIAPLWISQPNNWNQSIDAIVISCVAVCCTVLQLVVVCCVVLQRDLICFWRQYDRVCVVVCCSVLQRVAACCSVLQCGLICYWRQCDLVCCTVVQCHCNTPLQTTTRNYHKQTAFVISCATRCNTLQHTATHCNNLYV